MISPAKSSLLILEDVDASVLAEVSLVFPRKIDLSEAAVTRRDKTLLVFAGDDWYQFSVDSFK